MSWILTNNRVKKSRILVKDHGKKIANSSKDKCEKISNFGSQLCLKSEISENDHRKKFSISSNNQRKKIVNFKWMVAGEKNCKFCQRIEEKWTQILTNSCRKKYANFMNDNRKKKSLILANDH